MDRVFDNPWGSTRHSSTHNRQLVPVEVAIHEPIQPSIAQVAPQAAAHMAAQSSGWQTALLTGIAVAGLLSSGWLLFDLQRSARTLERERNVALVERLRANEKAVAPTPEPTTVDRLEPLTLPIQSLPMPPIGLAPTESMPISPLPVLTGVMQSPGGRSSAIFQINNASVSAEIGESLGSSGWTLASVGASSAVIRNNGQERTLSVGGVF
ncbi:MAG: pilus assembly protein PilZ [Parasynechococcus sp.]|tara:strand:+ start:280 stop:909 length:630 start_codon:yes stop_codon:yes gene_type:complete